MLRGYKYRLYPTVKQAELLNKHFGACRFVYNLALECRQMAYSGTKINLSAFELIKQLPDLKKDYSWLKEVDSQALQISVENMDRAFIEFYKGRAEFPKFKSKNRGSQSFTNPHGRRVKIKGNRIYIPKFREGIKFIQDRPIIGKALKSTVSRTATGKYYISLLVQTGEAILEKKPIQANHSIGIDLGLKHFIITSEGIKVDNPRHLQKAMSKLKFLQRQAYRKKKGGANRKKAGFKLALQHEKIANQRRDFLHKLSTDLVKNHDTLCFESLNIAGMIVNHRLAQSISSASWSEFVYMCKYKSEWNGKNVLQIPKFQPSTSLCSDCGTINQTLTLNDREWVCADCGTLHDRDINAATNIKSIALKNCVEPQRKKSAELPTIVGAKKRKVYSRNVAMSNFVKSALTGSELQIRETVEK